LPYVEYTSNVEEDVQTEKAMIAVSASSDILSVAPQQSRAVAKKSTAKKQNVDNTTYNPMIETKPSHSIIVS